MKRKDGFIARRIGQDYMVVPVGAQTVDFRCIMTLNDTGAFLWEQLQNDCTLEQLVSAMLDEYDVTEDRARTGVSLFLQEMEKVGLLA